MNTQHKAGTVYGYLKPTIEDKFTALKRKMDEFEKKNAELSEEIAELKRRMTR